MAHYGALADTSIPALRDVTFGWSSPDDVSSKLQEIESEWEAKIEESTTLAYGEKIIDCGEGYSWWDLKRGGCPIEGRLAGHCGNGHSRNDDVCTLLSFRKEVGSDRATGEPLYESHLTFVLRKGGGELTEMKGRHNEKPDPRYHPYIMELLAKYEPIETIVGGGYLPENNFQLSALAPSDFEKLLAERPSIFPLPTLLARYSPEDVVGGRPIKDEIKGFLEREMDLKQGFETHIVDGEPHYQVTLYSYSTAERAENSNLEKLAYYAPYIEGDDHLHSDYCCTADDMLSHRDIELEALLEKWFADNPEKKRQLTLFLQKENESGLYSDELLGDDPLDTLNFIDLLSICELDNFSLRDKLYSACISAKEAGMFNEIQEAIDEVMEDFYGSQGMVKLVENPKQSNETFAVISLEGFIELGRQVGWDVIQEEMEERHEALDIEDFWDLVIEHDILDIRDMDEPYYGFTGFCKETLKYRFEEEMDDLLPRLPEIVEQAPSIESAKKDLAQIREIEKNGIKNLQADEQELTQGTSRGL
jgi:hypothetical protein